MMSMQQTLKRLYDPQIAARLTALAAACKALEAAGSSKGAEGKIQRALAKLEKVEKPVLDPSAGPAPAPAEAAATANAIQQEDAAALSQPADAPEAAQPAQTSAPLSQACSDLDLHSRVLYVSMHRQDKN